MNNEISRKQDDNKRASVLQVAKAVMWSFMGIRKKSDLENDAEMITPVQVVIGGIIGGLIFVISLMLLVRLVVS
ncbi:MAG: hypothetical protein NMNS01_25020 [Nitrosomonas sp.]|nr:MAG: hypothetical protein NMNS01_25020 [Nitrosomonas sp.]